MFDNYQNLPIMNKTVLVSGANGRISLASSLLLARQGAQVIMVCSNQERGQKNQNHVAQVTGQKPDLYLTDMCLPEEI